MTGEHATDSPCQRLRLGRHYGASSRHLNPTSDISCLDGDHGQSACQGLPNNQGRSLGLGGQEQTVGGVHPLRDGFRVLPDESLEDGRRPLLPHALDGRLGQGVVLDLRRGSAPKRTTGSSASMPSRRRASMREAGAKTHASIPAGLTQVRLGSHRAIASLTTMGWRTTRRAAGRRASRPCPRSSGAPPHTAGAEQVAAVECHREPGRRAAGAPPTRQSRNGRGPRRRLRWQGVGDLPPHAWIGLPRPAVRLGDDIDRDVTATKRLDLSVDVPPAFGPLLGRPGTGQHEDPDRAAASRLSVSPVTAWIAPSSSPTGTRTARSPERARASACSPWPLRRAHASSTAA